MKGPEQQQQYREAEVFQFVEGFPHAKEVLQSRISERFAHSRGVGEDESHHGAIAALQAAHRDEQLVLVLGAGVSLDAGLPTWNTLLNQLMAQTIDKEGPVGSAFFAQVFSELFRPDSLMLGRYLQEYYRDGNANFEKVMQETLYKNYDLQATDKRPLLHEIVTLCIAAGRAPNLNAIITYNYDDVLEQLLKKNGLGIPFKSIYKVGDNPSPNELAIYHVHGFLPYDQHDLQLPEITFGESVYHKQYSDTYSWNNLVQINKFREATCLFIGLSLTDPNIRRLLDIAKAQRGESASPHYIFKKRYNIKDTEERLARLMKENTGILAQKVEAKLDFNSASDFLCGLANAYEQNDARSLGLEVIWVDEYDEIPQVLQRIREKHRD